MSAQAFTWTRDGRDHVDTVHLAGCAHNHLATPVATLAAASVEDALREIAQSMGWDAWPEPDDAEFELQAAPCARDGEATA